MVNLDLYAWIVRGSQRIAVLKAMSHPMTPTQILKKAKEHHEKLSLNNTSDTVRHFVIKGIAECMNGEAKTGRIYELTAEGKEIQEELLKD